MSNVFVAPKIKVGFQKRSDTFTGQLAYIIYYDEKGKIRKEKSWNSWRDHKIAPQEFDNKPMDGFTLNKDVKRYSGDWFSSHRTMIRVHDPRGFEFEVTTENLIGILMHTDCLRRGLVGQFVYAWMGPELVLLPTNSEEYQNATKFTTGLSKKVSAKDIVPGISYKTKREGDVIYIGRFNWYEYSTKGRSRYGSRVGLRNEEKVHVFTKDEGKSFFKKTSLEFLSEANSDVPVSNLANLVTKFNKKSYANKIVKFEMRPTSFDPTVRNKEYYGPSLVHECYFVENDGSKEIYGEVHVSARTERKPKADGTSGDYEVKGYNLSNDYYGKRGIKLADGELVQFPPTQDRSSFYYTRPPEKSLEAMQQYKFFDLFVTYESGKVTQVKSLYELDSEKGEIE